MRWERLFTDLEAQFAARRQSEIEGGGVDEAQLVLARGTMAQRLAAHEGMPLKAVLVSGRPVEGTCLTAGDGWLLVGTAAEQVLVPWAGLGWWEPRSRRLRPVAEARARVLGWGTVLRALQRRRESVRVVHCLGGTERETVGVLEAVGADYVQVGTGQAFDRAEKQSRILPMAQVLAIIADRGPSD